MNRPIRAMTLAATPLALLWLARAETAVDRHVGYRAGRLSRHNQRLRNGNHGHVHGRLGRATDDVALCGREAVIR